MERMERIEPAAGPLRGTRTVPGDKSISHRAAIMASVAPGRSVIRGFSPAGDCAATLDALRALGVTVGRRDDEVAVQGLPPGGLRSEVEVDCRRSGTTMRLLAGVLAGAGVVGTLTGEDQLLRRPMDRVAEPLRRMGADVRLGGTDTGPIRIGPGRRPLRGIAYRLPVASAQVKSAVLLAGLWAKGSTTVEEPLPTRDHTERLLTLMGVPVDRAARQGKGAAGITILPGTLDPLDLDVPGDVSSAAPLLAAAALIPGSDLTVEEVGLNPTRIGFLRVLEEMGAVVEVRGASRGGVEAVGAVRVASSSLRGVSVGDGDVPTMVDELPLVALMATQAEGVTEVRGAAELRLKESDRVAGLVAGLTALGADAEELPDGFVVRGPTPLRGGRCDALADHRLAMTFTVAGLIASGPVEVEGTAFLADSFPGFLEEVRRSR